VKAQLASLLRDRSWPYVQGEATVSGALANARKESKSPLRIATKPIKLAGASTTSSSGMLADDVHGQQDP